MSGKGIIQELYGPAESKALVELCRDEDPKVRQSLHKIVGEKLSGDERLLIQPGIDQLMLICSTSHFAYDERECINVAIFVHQGVRRCQHPIPSIDEVTDPLVFASKTLVALTFFLSHLERLSDRRAKPSPSYYRALSQSRFRMSGYGNVADHHVQWENLLSEKLGG